MNRYPTSAWIRVLVAGLVLSLTIPGLAFARVPAPSCPGMAGQAGNVQAPVVQAHQPSAMPAMGCCQDLLHKLLCPHHCHLSDLTPGLLTPGLGHPPRPWQAVLVTGRPIPLHGRTAPVPRHPPRS